MINFIQFSYYDNKSIIGGADFALGCMLLGASLKHVVNILQIMVDKKTVSENCTDTEKAEEFYVQTANPYLLRESLVLFCTVGAAVSRVIGRPEAILPIIIFEIVEIYSFHTQYLLDKDKFFIENGVQITFI